MESNLVEFEGRPRFCLEDETEAVMSQTLERWWRDLIEGRADLADGFSTDTEAFLALGPPVLHRCALSARHTEVLVRTMLGERSKVLAIEFDVSASTVAGLLKRSVQLLGWKDRPSALPVGLLALADSAQGHLRPGLRLYTGTLPDGSPCRVLRTPLAPLSGMLSRAVREVVRLHVAGKSYVEIAAHRATSTRTVANQLSTAFRILRVSGRNELRHYVTAGLANP